MVLGFPLKFRVQDKVLYSRSAVAQQIRAVASTGAAGALFIVAYVVPEPKSPALEFWEAPMPAEVFLPGLA